MASPKFIAMFFAFAVAAAALQLSEAARLQVQQGFKPAATTNQAAQKVAGDQADGGVPRTPPGIPPEVLSAILGMLFPPAADQADRGAPRTPPGIPPQVLSAILGMLFPPLGAIIGLLQPLLPPPGSPPIEPGVSLLSSSPPPPTQPTECMTPLMGMLPCMGYLTNTTVLTPPGECCDGLKAIIRDAPICLCHGVNGGMNKFLPKPVDPVRMTVLPLTCGATLPIQTLLMCNSQQVPPIMPPIPAEPPVTPATPPSASP